MSNGKPDLRLFIANARSDDESELTRLKTAIEIAAIKAFPAKTVIVTLGRDDFFTHKDRLGSWEAWNRDVATGIHPTTREPRFHGIVIPHDRFGAATAQIAQYAFGIGKPVLKWSAERGLTVAKSVVKVNERDFKTGWKAG